MPIAIVAVKNMCFNFTNVILITSNVAAARILSLMFFQCIHYRLLLQSCFCLCKSSWWIFTNFNITKCVTMNNKWLETFSGSVRLRDRDISLAFFLCFLSFQWVYKLFSLSDLFRVDNFWTPSLFLGIQRQY